MDCSFALGVVSPAANLEPLPCWTSDAFKTAHAESWPPGKIRSRTSERPAPLALEHGKTMGK